MKYFYEKSLSEKITKNILPFLPPGCEVYWIVSKAQNDGYVIAGINYNKPVYAASLSKVFIGAEVLRQVELGFINLQQIIPINLVNIVGDSRAIVKKDTNTEYWLSGQFSLDKLLKKMLGESDNTSANVLIDLVTRESINENIINKYGWIGCEVTRKFISRDKEEPRYKNARINLIIPIHILECFILIKENRFISFFVSYHLKEYMKEGNTNPEFSLYLSEYQNYFHKIGSVYTNLWSYGIWSAIKSALQLRIKNNFWQHDVCSFDYKGDSYCIALLTFTKSLGNISFPVNSFSKAIKDLI
ncbi:MAG: serine hydrolase [Saprospiraceae bacterium]|nr:serine hydrolase [Saprospiraceae bacterium]